MLYDYVNPKASEDDRVEFTSPVTKTRVDRVVRAPEEDCRIAFKAEKPEVKGGRCRWSAEVFVNWETLGLTFADDLAFRADFGIVCPDSGGKQSDRVYFWAEAPNTEISDLAVEARIHPAAWGTVKVKK